MRKEIIMIAVTLMMTGCNGGPKPQDSPVNDSISTEQRDTIMADSSCVLLSHTMGKIVSGHYADLSFEVSLPISQVLVKNGQKVKRGQVLVQLDQFKLRNTIEQQQRQIEQAQLQIEQSSLQMQDVIISQGYDPDKPASIPADVRHNAEVKSGHSLAKSQLATARTLAAAVVANLVAQAHQLSQPGQTVCRIIATDDMEVEFRVMEADLNKYKIGTRVSVIPVADNTMRYEAVVSEINPVVDEQGDITLRARLSGAQGLFDGMNVEVLVGGKN